MSVSVTRAEPITHAEPLVGTDMIPPLNEGDHLTREEFSGATMRCRISRKPSSLKESSTCLHRSDATIMESRT